MSYEGETKASTVTTDGPSQLRAGAVFLVKTPRSTTGVAFRDLTAPEFQNLSSGA